MIRVAFIFAKCIISLGQKHPYINLIVEVSVLILLNSLLHIILTAAAYSSIKSKEPDSKKFNFQNGDLAVTADSRQPGRGGGRQGVRPVA